MNRLAQQHPDIHFLLLHVREVHPGSKIPAHQPLQDKLCQARRLLNEEGEHRMILVDSLDGTAHEIYGELPNLIYVIDPQRILVTGGTGTLGRKFVSLIVDAGYNIPVMSHRVLLTVLQAGDRISMDRRCSSSAN